MLNLQSLLPLLGGLLLALPTPGDDEVEGDTIFLENDKTKEGRVVYEDDEVVILRKGSRETEYPRDEVKDVDSRVRSLNQLLDRLTDLGPRGYRDANALLELAQFCEAARLSGEAHMLYLATLLYDPENAGAIEALGCKQRKGHWSYKKGKKWVRNSELSAGDIDWKDRWELNSVHFTLQSNLPLGKAIKAMWDLERFYRTFFELFQHEVRLLEPDEVMDIHVHGDDKSYPENGDGRKGWFDPGDRITHLNASRSPWLDTLLHEGVHHLFYMTTVRSPGGKGKIPAWLDEGMAEAFGTGIDGDLGFATIDIGKMAPGHFREQANADKPYGFSRVLAFESDDYLGSVDRNLKYAQSYTLVYYLIFGNGGDRKDQFMEFMRSAYDGKSSSTDFQKILEIDSKDKFEKEWYEGIDAIAAGF